MRVLYLTNSPHIGGGNRSLQMLWEAGVGMGIRPHAVCPADGAMVSLCRQNGISVAVLPYRQPGWRNPVASLRAFSAWKRVIRWSHADLIHANDFSSARSIGMAARSLSIPVVCHIHYHQSEQAIQWFFRGIPKPSAFVHNSNATESLCGPIISRLYPRSRQVRIYNCVPVVEQERPFDNGDKTRPRRVGIVGNLIPIKGHTDFLEMARLLTLRGTEAEYWVIGDDIHHTGHERALKELTANLGLNDRVKFFGFRSDVRDLLAELDVLVVASHVEPFGIVSLEGMASKLPVVGTRVGGIPEAIEDGVTGFLVSPRAPLELAEKVDLLLSNSQLRETMGQAGRKRVEALFSPETYASNMAQLYAEVLSG